MLPKNRVFIVYMLAACLLCALVYWVCGSPAVAYETTSATYAIIDTGWVQVIDGERVALDDIADYTPTAAGEPLVLEYTISDVQSDDVLLFYTQHVEVIAYVGDTLVQNFTMQEGFEFLKTPGRAWNQIELSSEMSGMTIRLELTSAFGISENALYPIYAVKAVDASVTRLSNIWFQIAIAVLLFCLMLASYINGIVWKNVQRRSYFFAAGRIYLVFFLWQLANLNAYDLVFRRPLLSYLLGMLFVHMMPFFLHRFLAIGNHAHRDLSRFFEVLTIACIFVPWVLQFACGISLLETLWVNAAVFLLIILSFALMTLYRIAKKTHAKTLTMPYLLTNIPIAGFVLDLWFLVQNGKAEPYWGLFSFCTCIIYNIIVYLLFAFENATLAHEKSELEKAYQLLHSSLLTQQMKAHFIFNTLNTISALCKEDAAAADHATKLFAKYLHSYTYLMRHSDNIPFERELEHIRAYLEIEKLRFGDALHCVYQLEETDFALPPLTIAPIVENAVVHGIRARAQAGTLTIASRHVGGAIEITVTDDGVGFDARTQSSEECAGLRGIETRLTLTANATLHIESEVLEGTCVTVRIPL